MTTILDGNPSPKDKKWIQSIDRAISLSNGKEEIRLHRLAQMNLGFCRGCFNCWWKTPGICTIRDDIDEILTDIINSKRVVFASPLIRGMLSAEIKKVQDRMIPLVHPFMTLVNGEVHHKKRYKNYPLLCVWYSGGTYEQRRLVYQMHKRLAINFHTTFDTIKNIT